MGESFAPMSRPPLLLGLLYAQALEAWRQRKPAEATRLLDAALQVAPDDGPSLALRVRSESAQWEPVSLIDPIRNLKK